MSVQKEFNNVLWQAALEHLHAIKDTPEFQKVLHAGVMRALRAGLDQMDGMMLAASESATERMADAIGEVFESEAREIARKVMREVRKK